MVLAMKNKVLTVFCFFVFGFLFNESAIADNFYEKESLKTSKDAVFISLVGLVFSVLGFFVLWQTLINSIELGKKSTRVSAAELRPYINITDVSLNSVCAGGEYDNQFLYFDMNLCIDNKGKTPALDVKLKKGSISFQCDGEVFLAERLNGVSLIGPDSNELCSVSFISPYRDLSATADQICVCIFEIEYKSIIDEIVKVVFYIQLNLVDGVVVGKPMIKLASFNPSLL